MRESATVLYSEEPIAVFDPALLGRLKEMALTAPLKRARLCLHHSVEDAVQEMVIVLHKTSLIRPHRHVGKSESFHMIEGEVAIRFFDDAGKNIKTVQLSASQGPFLYRLSAPHWHSVHALSEFAIFHEVSMGPFVPCEYPAWEKA